MSHERRKYQRPASTNLLDFQIIGAEEKGGEYAMGRTLNVSIGGILLESHLPLHQGQRIRITLDLEGELIDLCGMVAHTTHEQGKRYLSGISFYKLSLEDSKILEKYVTAFRESNPNTDQDINLLSL